MDSVKEIFEDAELSKEVKELTHKVEDFVAEELKDFFRELKAKAE